MTKRQLRNAVHIGMIRGKRRLAFHRLPIDESVKSFMRMVEAASRVGEALDSAVAAMNAVAIKAKEMAANVTNA